MGRKNDGVPGVRCQTWKQLVILITGAAFWCGLLGQLHAEAPEYLIPKHSEWKYYAAKTAPPDSWNQIEFDDQNWKSEPAGFGYGDADDRTVLAEMRGTFTSVYIRREFEIDDVDSVDALYLYVNFDDGFIAYLNGQEVASASVSREDGELLVELHEAEGYQEFEIRDANNLLRAGKNLLAIEGHNADIDSSDFSLDPCLTKDKLPSIDSLISAEDFLADLDEFEERLLDQSSYLTRLGYDYKPELSELRQSINKQTTVFEFASALQKIVMQIGDSHAGVYSRSAWPIRGFLPLRPADTGDGLAALKPLSDQPLDVDCPYIESIDGVPLERWLAAAAQYAPQGSPQLIRRRSLGWLGLFTILRDELGVPNSDTVSIGLRSADGKKQCQQTHRLNQAGYSVAMLRLGHSRLLDDNIGYLRIPRMDRRLVDITVRKIREFRDTDGLIIDVRNNAGGTYFLLHLIYGFFVPDEAEPYVSNIAAYRLSPRFREDHIAYRPTFRAEWDGWNDAERKAIDRAAAAFKPEWQPPADQFSKWHYMVLSRERGGLDYFYYDKPVVVLSNAGSFSATDGFLGAFSDLPQVTIVGEPSGGGSGATRRFQLRNTEVHVALSSMASYRANGKTFDGNGIAVDVLAKPTIEDYITESDSVLDRGIAVIRQKLPAK